MLPLSISLGFNRMEADLFKFPHLCDKAHVLATEFLDQVETVRELMMALETPRTRKSRLEFLRFVFERDPSCDQTIRDRKLKRREMNSLSLVLCSVTYTTKMILTLSEPRFRALLSSCCKFLGGPGNFAARLPAGVVEQCLAANVSHEEPEAYKSFCEGSFTTSHKVAYYN